MISVDHIGNITINSIISTIITIVNIIIIRGHLANAMGQKVGLLAGNWVSQCLLERERPDHDDSLTDC